LDFFGLRGKKQPTHHVLPQHVSRLIWHNASPYLCSQPKAYWWPESHSPREGDPTRIGQYPREAGIPTAGFHVSPKNKTRRLNNESYVSASPCRSTQKTLNFHGFVFHGPCNADSDNRKSQLSALKISLTSPPSGIAYLKVRKKYSKKLVYDTTE
jgi:hypothetical protein